MQILLATHTSRLFILLQILDRLYHCRKTQLLSSTAYNNANFWYWQKSASWFRTDA